VTAGNEQGDFLVQIFDVRGAQSAPERQKGGMGSPGFELRSDVLAALRATSLLQIR